jgi:hypothetical protein
MMMPGLMPIGSNAADPIYLKTEFQDVPPKFVTERNNSISGISYDIIRMITRDGQVNFIYGNKPVPLIRSIWNLERGITEVQVCVQKTPERERSLVFGEPLYEVKTFAMVRINDRGVIRSLNDLRSLGPETEKSSPSGERVFPRF